MAINTTQLLDYLNKDGNKRTAKRRLIVRACAVLIFGGCFIFLVASIAPTNFPSGTIVSITKGMTLSQAADMLQNEHVIRSTSMYKAFVVLLGTSKSVIEGDYLFNGPESVIRVAYRTINGIEGIPQARETIQEGLDSGDIAALLGSSIKGFATSTFEQLARNEDGFLFPDTYYWPINVSPQTVVSDMQANFNRKIATIAPQIAAFGKPMEDVITMASIIEREANDDQDRKIIAGILWKRIQNDMPLQVDPPFYYLSGIPKNSALTVKDLATTSPYNTYKHLGLPPTPIGNPGLDAITDTITPATSTYWFYLSDRQGNIHYAATFDEHVANENKYF